MKRAPGCLPNDVPQFDHKTIVPPSRSPHVELPRAAAVKGGRQAGAERPLPLTAASTAASFRRSGRRLVIQTAKGFRARVIAAVLIGCLVPMPRVAWSQSTVDRWAHEIAEAAERFGIPDLWIREVMRAESGGDASATSPAGAMGLMQIMPSTFAVLRERYGLDGDPYDPRTSVLAGAAYLRELHDRFGDNGFLAAYNAGEARYEQHLRSGQPLPDETTRYVAAIRQRLAASTGIEELEVRPSVASMPIRRATEPQIPRLFVPSSAAGMFHVDPLSRDRAAGSTLFARGSGGRPANRAPSDARSIEDRDGHRDAQSNAFQTPFVPLRSVPASR